MRAVIKSARCHQDEEQTATATFQSFAIRAVLALRNFCGICALPNVSCIKIERSEYAYRVLLRIRRDRANIGRHVDSVPSHPPRASTSKM